MYKLRYLEQAKNDLVQIKHYIAKESGSVGIGLNFTEKLRQQCRGLAATSGMIGQARPELGKEIRSFPYGNYVILFRYNDDYLDVITIVEGHRDIQKLLQ